MSMAMLVIEWVGKVAFGVVLLLLVTLAVVFGYNIILKDWFDYRKARKEVFAFVDSYKKRCTGNNRFVVTPETLQDSFREYDTKVITKVWMELVNQRVIVADPQDQVWCVR